MKLIVLTLLNGHPTFVNTEKINYIEYLPSHEGSKILFDGETKINVQESLKDILTLIKEESKWLNQLNIYSHYHKL